jgi:hypothetical protein
MDYRKAADGARGMDLHKDFKNEKLVFHKSQDVAPIIKANREESLNPVADLSFGRKFASVPIDVLDAWIKHDGLDYRTINKDPEMRKRFFERLNSRDWSGFKVHNGSL